MRSREAKQKQQNKPSLKQKKYSPTKIICKQEIHIRRIITKQHRNTLRKTYDLNEI